VKDERGGEKGGKRKGREGREFNCPFQILKAFAVPAIADCKHMCYALYVYNSSYCEWLVC